MGSFIPLLEKHEKNIEKKGLTITVSGSSGTGKSSFAKKVAQICDLKYMSAGNIFRKMAQEQGIPLEEFCRTRGKGIDIMIEKKLLELAQKGGYVLDGRMSGLAAGTFADKRVLVKAKKKLIAERLAERDDKSYEQALMDLEKRNKFDYEKYRKIYGMDPKKESHYTNIVKNNGTYEELMKKAESFANSCLEQTKK